MLFEILLYVLCWIISNCYRYTFHPRAPSWHCVMLPSLVTTCRGIATNSSPSTAPPLLSSSQHGKIHRLFLQSVDWRFTSSDPCFLSSPFLILFILTPPSSSSSYLSFTSPLPPQIMYTWNFVYRLHFLKQAQQKAQKCQRGFLLREHSPEVCAFPPSVLCTSNFPPSTSNLLFPLLSCLSVCLSRGDFLLACAAGDAALCAHPTCPDPG